MIDIDFSKTPQRPQLYLCKPNRTIIGKLNEAFNIIHKIKLGNVSELSFSIPYQIELNHQLQDNLHIDLLRCRYLIKLVYKENNYEEWFLIDKPLDNMEEDNDYKNIQCFSLEIELKDKKIKNYNVTSYNATQLLTDVLEDTLWTIDYIHPEFNNTYRSIDISLKSALDLVFEIANTFKAIPIFNTINRTISLYKENDIGIDRGLKFSYGKYLKNLNKELNLEEFCTKLKVFGQDNISINEVNPTGYNYLFDYSYFLYPYSETITDELNDIYTVDSSSDYMSDDLCHNILKYNKLLESKNGVEDIAEVGTTTTNITMTDHGLVDGDWILNKTRYNEYRKITVVDTNNITVTAIDGQTDGDIILKYTDDTFRKLLFQKEEKQNELTTLNNELDVLETEKLIVLDNISIQQENNTITTYDFIYNGTLITKTTEINNAYKYAVMCKASSTTDLTVTLDGVAKTLSNNTWEVLGKISNQTSTTVEFSGTATNIDIKIVIVKITDEEFITTDNESNIIEKYNLNNKETQIDAKQNEITNKQTEIDNIDVEITNIRTELAFENNFTSEQLNELIYYNKEDVYENNNIDNAQDLYDIAIEEFTKRNNPQTIINIDSVNFLQCIECQKEWDKLNLGDIVRVKHELLNIDNKAKIMEIEFLHEEGDINLTIADIKDILSDKDRFLKKIYDSIYTTNNLNQKKVDWNTITYNFNSRNDRNSTTPADPVVASDGTAIDHSINTDGSCDISFKWTYDGSGDGYNIDGFIVYIRSTSSNESYIFGSTIAKEQIYNVSADKRTFILYGVPVNQYYTFGIQAYRKVDSDINANGILKSNIIKSTNVSENPYLPSVNVAFSGDVVGTIEGVATNTVVSNAQNGTEAYSGTVKYRSAGAPTNTPTPTGINHEMTKSGNIDITLSWDIYTQGEKQADMLFLFWKKGDTSALGAPTINDSCITFNVNTIQASYYTFEGLASEKYYSFGIAAARRTENGLEVGSIISPTATPNWQDITQGSPDYVGTIDGTIASTVKTNAANGQTAYTDTAKYRSPGAPTNAPTPTAIDVDTNKDGSIDIKLSWGVYTQGTLQADMLLLFWKKGTAAGLGAPTVDDSCLVFNVNTINSSFYQCEGLASEKYYSFGIAAARRTENGLEIGAIQSPTSLPNWQDITQGSPDYLGNVAGVPAEKVNKTPVTIIVADGSTSQNINRADYVVDAGSTSAQVKINEAIASLPATGGRVVLLEGTYTIGGTISLPSNVALEGQGVNTIIKLRDNHGSNLQLIRNSDDINGNVYIGIKNLKIDGNKANQDASLNHWGVYLYKVSESLVTNIVVVNCCYQGITLSGSSINNIIMGNTLQNNDWESIALYNSSKRNTITGNIIQGNVGEGILIRDSSDNTVTGNVCQGNNMGIDLQFSSYCTLSGNTCQGNSLYGIKTHASHHNTIAGNVCQGNGRNGICIYSSSHNTVASNTCEANSQTTDNTYDNLMLDWDSNYNNVQTNTCRKGTLTNKPRYGIRINHSYCDGNLITNNDLYDSGISGSFSDAGTGTITVASNRL